MSCKAAGLISDAVSAFAMAGQMCVDFVRSAGRQAYRLLEERFDEVGESGVVPSEVERIAADRGWQTRNGRPWTARQVLDAVSNPVYTDRFRAASGTRPAVHEPIVSQDTFLRCADAIAARRTGTSGPRQRRMWSTLQGKVRCAR